MIFVKLSLLLTSLLELYSSSFPLGYCQELNVTSVALGLGVTDRYEVTDDVTTSRTKSNSHVVPLDNTTIASQATTGCSLSTADPFVYNLVTQLVRENKASLIEYRLNFTNYTVNPLSMEGATDAYRADRWSRITTSHGQTLLSLAFNYGVLSMSTLTFGTETLHIELVDSPSGCFGEASQGDMITTIQYLLMRDFKADGPLKTVGDARVCHEVILDDNGYAQFRHNCCYVNTINKRQECTTEIGNVYLDLLYAMLSIVRVALVFFSPAIFIGLVDSMSKERIPYVVVLKDKLRQTIWLCSDLNMPRPQSFGSELNLRATSGFPKFLDKVKKLGSDKLDKKLLVEFDEYHIAVDYERTLKENTVPVGLFQTLFMTLFKCGIRHIGPFQKCCERNIFSISPLRGTDTKEIGGTDKKEIGVRWSTFCRQFSKLIFVMIIPIPFYIRLWLFYAYEEVELYSRKEAMAVRGLREHYDNSVVHYFTPSHFFFICMYLVYIMSAIAIAFLDKRSDEKYRPKSIIVNSFKDLKKLNWANVLSMAVSNLIWPLDRFGIYGCVVGLFYWPLVLLYTAVICIVYLLPTLYLCLRMILNAKEAVQIKERRSKNNLYQVRTRIDEDMHALEIFKCIGDSLDSLPYPQGVPDEQIMCDDLDHIKIDHIKRSYCQPHPTTRTNTGIGNVSVSSGGESKRGNVQCAQVRVLESDCSTSDNEESVSLFIPNGVLEPDNGKTVFNNDQNVVESVNNSGGQVGGGKEDEDGELVIKYDKYDRRRVFESILSAFLGIVTLFSCVIIMSEVIGFLVEIATFTIMGVIVNAATLLRYVILLLIICVYCCDCFKNITTKYLKMNKSLFTELESRHSIRSVLETETSKSSKQQQNMGFKAQELSQQATYEHSDQIPKNPPGHWIINDLVMFVDNEDMPRIPRKLFEEVCGIRTAGVPGPVYRGHIEAVTSLIKIILFVCFVFVIILSFGTVYRVSSTNQMLATLLCGFIPMVLKTFLSPPAPDVELKSVSFRNKLTEVVNNFWQVWPMHDLPFQLVNDNPPNATPNSEKAPETVNNKTENREPATDTVAASTNNSLNATFANYCSMFNASLVAVVFLPNIPNNSIHQGAEVDERIKDSKTGEGAEQDNPPEVDLIIYLPTGCPR